MSVKLRLTRLRVVLLGAVLALGLGGFAFAAVVGADGVIRGCYDTKTGALRVIDAEAGQSCESKETALSWNQTGPQGPQGIQGETGPQGPTGATGPAGTAEAYANIRWDGTNVVVFSARGMTAANVKRVAPGIYCVEGLSFRPRIAIGNGLATIRLTGQNADGSFNFAPTGHDTNVTTQVAIPGSFLAFCDTSLEEPNPTVRIYVGQEGVGLADRPFAILLDD